MMWFDLRRRDPDVEGPEVLRRELRVEAPPPVVFGLFADDDELARWCPGLRRARWLTAAPHGVGSLRARELRGLRVVDHVVAWDPERRLTTWVERATLPFARELLEDVRLEPADGGTRVVWALHVGPHRWARPAWPPIRARLRRWHARAAANLAARATLPRA